MPKHIPKKDLKVLESVKRKAYRLDLQLSICGFRIGWAGVIGLIPWIGDIIAFYLALQVIKKAGQIEGGLPSALKSKMMSNATFDFGIGLIPIVGDIINIAYKCNSRNFILLEQHLTNKYDHENHRVEEPTNYDKKSAGTSAGATTNSASGNTVNQPVKPNNPALPPR